DLARGVEIRDELLHCGFDGVVNALTLVSTDDLAVRVDDDVSWPGLRAILRPDREIRVVDDRMLDAEPEHGLLDAVIGVLAVVLAGMHADDREGVTEFALEVGQVGDDVLTVDTAECPEVE